MTNVALTSDENTALAGVSTRSTYLSVVPSTTVATARVNGSLAYPIAQIPTTSESGGWTNGKRGMTVLIGTAAGLSDVAIFRCRADVTGTGSISVAEFGTNDTGLVSVASPIPVANAQYLTIIDRKDIWAVFPRIDYNGGTIASIYEDYDRTDILQNLLPSPIVRIKTNNSHGGHYATKVADGATVAITAVATVQHWPSSSTVLSYQWVYPAGFTGVSGATSATLTATAPVGNHEISCTVTADYGAAITAYRRVHVHDDTVNPAIHIANVGGDTRNTVARRIPLDLNNTSVTGIPDGAMCIVFDMATWNGTTVPTATTTFVGWLAQIGFSTGGGLRQSSPEIVGVGEILNSLTNTSQLFEVTNIPTVWQQMGYQLATYNWVIWWILTFRASGVMQNFNFYPYSTSASVGRMPAFDVGAGSILSQVRSLAARYRKGSVNTGSGGEVYVTVPAHMIETASRSGLTTRLALTASKVTNISWRRDIRPRVRQVEGQGFTWDGASALPTPLKAVVPERPGQGSSDDTLGEQIVASQAELNTITGLYYNWVNNPISSVTITIPKNYDVLEPAEGTLVNVTVPATYSPTGVEWVFDATVVSVNKRYLAGGGTEMDVTVEPLTSGEPGKTVPVPLPGENLDSSLPPFDEIFPIEPYPDWGAELVIDPDAEVQLDPQPGAAVEYPSIYGGTDDGHAWKVANSSFADISPVDGLRNILGTGLQLVQDAWNYSIGYLVGTLAVLRSAGITGASPKWTSILRYFSGTTEDLTVTDGDFVPVTDGGDQGVWNSGSGWDSVDNTEGDGNRRRIVDIIKTIPSTTITSVTVTYDLTRGTYGDGCGGSQGLAVYIALNGTILEELHCDDASDGTGLTLTWTGTATGVTTVNLGVISSFQHSAALWDGFARITAVDIQTPTFVGATDESIIGAFTCYQNKKSAYCWLTKRTISAVDYVFFNRTLDNFSTRQQVQVATWVADMNYSIAISPHNWRFVWCTAGDPAGSDAFVYRSADGGGSFVATSVGLYPHGGQLSWNWSTSTPNTPNTSNVNLLIVRGLNGSNDYLIRVGVAGSDVTIANGAGKYGLVPTSLYQLPRDGDFVVVGLQDNSVRKSSNFATSFSGGTSASGTELRGIWQWPTDSAFGLLFGDGELEYTIDTYATYVDMYSAYSTFASGAYGAGGTVIIGAWIDLGQHYIRPVASEA